MRQGIIGNMKLELAFRHLDTCGSFSSLENFYGLPISTISKLILPVLNTIYKSFDHIFLMFNFVSSPLSNKS